MRLGFESLFGVASESTTQQVEGAIHALSAFASITIREKSVRDYQALKERDLRDALNMSIANSSYLHNSIGTPPCSYPKICEMCTHAARLAVQHYRPVLERRFIEEVGMLFNIPTGYSPPSSD